MSYREFQRKNPNWPKRLKDMEGRTVKLKREITTRGGDTFKAGQVMVVTYTSQGHLHVRDPDDPRLGIRHVWKTQVELVEQCTSINSA